MVEEALHSKLYCRGGGGFLGPLYIGRHQACIRRFILVTIQHDDPRLHGLLGLDVGMGDDAFEKGKGSSVASETKRGPKSSCLNPSRVSFWTIYFRAMRAMAVLKPV